jgi:hypothetical protein
MSSELCLWYGLAVEQYTQNDALLCVSIHVHYLTYIHFNLLKGLGCFQRRNSWRCTSICTDCYCKMCSALANCIPSRCHGELDRLHVNSNGNWLKLVGEQDGGDFFPYLSICHAWFGAFDCKFVFSAPWHDAWRDDDYDGFLDEESAARHFR